MSILQSTRLVLAPPHRAGFPFLAGGLVAMLAGLLLWQPLAWLGLLFVLFCLYFFRDPERVAPARAGVILAPADGRIVVLDQAPPPAELDLGNTPRWRVGIFLSVLDVHINRVPAAGTVTRIAYRHGKFLDASLDKASDENERNAMAIRLPTGSVIAVVQIAGLIARRIVCEVAEGDALAAGARYGLIRFGSRTDLYLPEGVEPLVAIGQRMVGGETVIAEPGRAGMAG
jgi:phosphatidylserine decarboxylase